MKREARVTDFRRSVYDAVSRVPRGFVTTYLILAKEVGCRSSRAVGQALRVNPFSPTVPCHRVIASDLGVGGFQGRTEGRALEKKLRLLKREGVRFSRGKLSDPSRIYRFD